MRNNYSNTLDTDKSYKAMNELRNNCTHKEIMWIIRNYLYSVWEDLSEENGYSQLSIEQGTMLKQDINTKIDLLEQIMTDKRSYDKDYLKQYESAGYYVKRCEELEKDLGKIKQLSEEINELI